MTSAYSQRSYSACNIRRRAMNGLLGGLGAYCTLTRWILMRAGDSIVEPGQYFGTPTLTPIYRWCNSASMKHIRHRSILSWASNSRRLEARVYWLWVAAILFIT